MCLMPCRSRIADGVERPLLSAPPGRDGVRKHESVESVESVGPPSDIKNTGPRHLHLHLHIPLRWLAIGALVAVLAGVGGWLGWGAIEHHQRDVASAQALDAA